jgi:ATP-dependent protease ClpP protease subunit
MWSEVVKLLVDQILALSSGEDIHLYQNTPGGSVFAGWALAGVMKEHDGETTIKAFGNCSSMGFYNLLYADVVHSLSVTKFTIHRADAWTDTEDEKKRLESINKDLRAAMEAKIDEEKFVKITGKTFDEIFDPEKRIEVTIDAKQAKKLGIVDKIIQLSTKEIKAISEKFAAFSDIFNTDPEAESESLDDKENTEPKADLNKNKNPKNPKQMTIIEIKEKHPVAYKEIIALGVKVGVAAEKDRVGSLMAFNAVDPKAVKAAIDSGEPISETFRSDMAVKMAHPDYQAKIKEDSTEEIDPNTETKEEKAKTEEDKEVEALKNEVFANLKLKKEDK